MYKVILVIALCLSSILAMPFGLHGNDDELYVLAPLSRVQRSVDIFSLPRNDISGSLFANNKLGPPTVGANLGYTHLPTGNNVNIGASSTRGLGSDVLARATYNIVHKPDLTIGATGYYARHFGGPFGTGRPNYGVVGTVDARF